MLTVLYLVMILADFIAPYNFTATHRNFIYAPPTKIRFFDEDGRWRPFVLDQEQGSSHVSAGFH